MNFVISKLTITDTALINDLIENVLDVSNSTTIKHFETLITDDRTYLLVAQTENNVIGYVLAYRFPSLYSADYLAYLYDIDVLPEYRMKGVGRKLIETLLADLKQYNVSELWLGTATDNHSGQALFSKTGAIKSTETFNDYTYEL